MQKLIKEQGRMGINIVQGLLLVFLLFQGGCVVSKKNIKVKKLSCEEDAKPKSLQYLEQQYRCTTNK